MIDTRRYLAEKEQMKNLPAIEQVSHNLETARSLIQWLYSIIQETQDIWNYNDLETKVLTGEIGNENQVRLLVFQVILNHFLTWDATPIDDVDFQSWLDSALGAENPDVTALAAALPTDGKTPHAIISRREWDGITLS